MENIQKNDRTEQNISRIFDTIKMENLPPEILAQIFTHLDYCERIRLERVCCTWRMLAQSYAWKQQHILRFKMLLNEPWKDKKRINSMIDELDKQQSKVRENMVQDYRLNHLNCYGREEECQDCPRKTKDGKFVHTYEERLKQDQQRAMSEYRTLFTDPDLYKQNRPTKQLGPLKAILRRCSPYLDEFHLLGPFSLAMQFGRIFPRLAPPFGRLAHLHIDDVRLDCWHLLQIQRHLAPQLLSLAVIPDYDNAGKSLMAFKELLANCDKLENLLISGINFGNLFAEQSGSSGNSQSSLELVPIKPRCSFMPATLQFLRILDNSSVWRYQQNIEELASDLLSLLAQCSQLRFMQIKIYSEFDPFQLIEQRNPREFERMLRFQFPFFIARHHLSTFSYIQRPEFQNLKAIQLDFAINADDIVQLAKYCPNLGHLDFQLFVDYVEFKDVVKIQDLVALYQFRSLSSLAISLDLGHRDDYYEEFHLMSCPGGEPADIALLGILTELDKIHPLRSFVFKPYIKMEREVYCAHLTQDYLLKMITQLKHLETLTCGLFCSNNEYNVDSDMDIVGEQFCAKLKEIFDSQDGNIKKSFKFWIGNDYPYDGDKKMNLHAEWLKGPDNSKEAGNNCSRMDWHCMPCTWNDDQRDRQFRPARSIVLNELITAHFGQRQTSSMLFNSFDLLMEER